MPTVREERTRLEGIVQQLQRTIQRDPQSLTAQQSLSGAQAALDRFIQNHRARGDDDPVLEVGTPRRHDGGRGGTEGSSSHDAVCWDALWIQYQGASEVIRRNATKVKPGLQ